MEALIDTLLEGGHLGLFAAFLVYQFLVMQKRLDRVVDGFQEQIEEIRKDYDQRTDRMRERYDRVISEYREREDTQSKEIVHKLDRLIDRGN